VYMVFTLDVLITFDSYTFNFLRELVG